MHIMPTLGPILRLYTDITHNNRFGSLEKQKAGTRDFERPSLTWWQGSEWGKKTANSQAALADSTTFRGCGGLGFRVERESALSLLLPKLRALLWTTAREWHMRLEALDSQPAVAC